MGETDKSLPQSHSAPVLVTVHGIRTFGQWQYRLGELVKKANKNIITEHYGYGYFSVFAFMLPPFRWLAVKIFLKELKALLDRHPNRRIILIGHSNGTYLIGHALLKLPEIYKSRIFKVILSGSVLRSDFAWSRIIDRLKITQVINDCGINDQILLISQLFVLFTGAAGRFGFYGSTGHTLVNRYFIGGHSHYFESSEGASDKFMQDYWLPIINVKKDITNIDFRETIGSLGGVKLWLLQNADFLKLTSYCALVYITVSIGFLAPREAATQAELIRSHESAVRALSEETLPELGLIQLKNNIALTEKGIFNRRLMNFLNLEQSNYESSYQKLLSYYIPRFIDPDQDFKEADAIYSKPTDDERSWISVNSQLKPISLEKYSSAWRDHDFILEITSEAVLNEFFIPDLDKASRSIKLANKLVLPARHKLNPKRTLVPSNFEISKNMKTREILPGTDKDWIALIAEWGGSDGVEQTQALLLIDAKSREIMGWPLQDKNYSISLDCKSVMIYPEQLATMVAVARQEEFIRNPPMSFTEKLISLMYSSRKLPASDAEKQAIVDYVANIDRQGIVQIDITKGDLTKARATFIELSSEEQSLKTDDEYFARARCGVLGLAAPVEPSTPSRGQRVDAKFPYFKPESDMWNREHVITPLARLNNFLRPLDAELTAAIIKNLNRYLVESDRVRFPPPEPEPEPKKTIAADLEAEDFDYDAEIKKILHTLHSRLKRETEPSDEHPDVVMATQTPDGDYLLILEQQNRNFGISGFIICRMGEITDGIFCSATTAINYKDAPVSSRNGRFILLRNDMAAKYAFLLDTLTMTTTNIRDKTTRFSVARAFNDTKNQVAIFGSDGKIIIYNLPNLAQSFSYDASSSNSLYSNSADTSGPSLSALAFYRDLILVRSEPRNLIAISMKDNKIQWSSGSLGRMSNQPIKILVDDASGNAFVYTEKYGRLLSAEDGYWLSGEIDIAEIGELECYLEGEELPSADTPDPTISEVVFYKGDPTIRTGKCWYTRQEPLPITDALKKLDRLERIIGKQD